MATPTPAPKSTKPLAAPLVIQSAARIVSPYVRLFVYGGENTGKTLMGVTAPGPVIWLLTEEMREESLRRDIIESIYPPPSEEAILVWMSKQDPASKPEELKKILAENRDDILKEMTGITYEMPMLKLTHPDHLKDAVELLKSGAYQTAIVDSLSNLSKIVLDYTKLYGSKSGGPMRHGMQAFGKTGGDILDFVRSLLPLPMHFVFIGHGKQYQINRGTEDEPLMVSVASPIFEGKKILNELPFLISHIFSARNTGRRTDKGKPVFALRTRKKEPEDYERTLCLRLNEDEEPNLTNIFNKILGK